MFTDTTSATPRPQPGCAADASGLAELLVSYPAPITPLDTTIGRANRRDTAVAVTR